MGRILTSKGAKQYWESFPLYRTDGQLTNPSRAAKAVQLIEDPKGGLIATRVVTAWRTSKA